MLWTRPAKGSLGAGDSTTRSSARGTIRRIANNWRWWLKTVEQTPRTRTVLSTRSSTFVKADAGADPIRTSTLNSEAFKKASPDSYEVVRTGLAGDPLPWPTVPQAPQLLQTLVDELALGLQGKQSAKQALENTQRAWTKKLNGPGG